MVFVTVYFGIVMFRNMRGQPLSEDEEKRRTGELLRLIIASFVILLLQLIKLGITKPAF
jgi:hypothetical protein